MEGGTAIFGQDYKDAVVDVDFPANTPSQTVQIQINNDGRLEPNETFSASLVAPVQGSVVNPDTAQITIINDDSEFLIFLRQKKRSYG